MTTPLIHQRPGRRANRWRRPGGEAGFSLVEVIVASGVFTLVMGSIVYLYLFSAKAASGVGQQLVFNTQARVVNYLINEIKSSQQTIVETYNGTSFSPIAMGQPQQGNALVLTVPTSPAATTNTMQVYYWLSSTGNLYRAVLNAGNAKLWLSNITNTLPFAVKNYQGLVASNLLARTFVDVNIYCVDPNRRNFYQAIVLHCGAQQRN